MIEFENELAAAHARADAAIASGKYDSERLAAALRNQERRLAPTRYISSAFSLGMISPEDLPDVRMCAWTDPRYADEDECDSTGPLVSIVGHADTARVLGVACNRRSVQLHRGDELYVSQLQGGRLPEGATTLPHGALFKWILVEIV